MAEISLTFPDGNSRKFPAGVTPADVAADATVALERMLALITIAALAFIRKTNVGSAGAM